ncbi:MAG: flagellin lysine-N-methylase [Candidatus Ornithomonoglobus sp.]
MVTPDYYDKFKCIGGECIHNCCRGGWEIEVDEDALERFGKIEGELGDRVRASINDENVFVHRDGQCPLLRSDGWCEMALNGHELCVVCDEYPRFTEFWEDYSERGISLSCEAAAEIILNNANKVKLSGESGTCSHPIFGLIYNAREKIFEILQSRDTDIFKRMRLALDYACELQDRINENNYEPFEYEPRDCFKEHESLEYFIELISGLENLYPSWKDMLSCAAEYEKDKPRHKVDPIKGEQLAVYFVYRYFLKGAFDCEALDKMKLAVLSTMTIIALENAIGDLAECARMYSIEVEHDEDNIDAIYDEFLFSDELSFDNVVNMID